MLKIDETKLSHQDIEYIDKILYDRFHSGAKRKECESILKIRAKLELDIHKNFMVSDYEYEYNAKVIFKTYQT